MPATKGLNDNLAAFLTMIGKSEGTVDIPNSDDGYLVLVGGTLFHSYHDHPRIKVWIENLRGYSTAAGRYQILERYFDFYKKELKLSGPDYFCPENQDIIAQKMITECHAMSDIYSGQFEIAVGKCKSRWASFYGADYKGQHTNSIDFLASAYQQAGGTFA